MKDRPNALRRRWSVFRSALCGIALVTSVVAVTRGQPGYAILEVYSRQKPPVAQPTDDVAHLIADLSKDSPETRASARRRLLAMGPEIEPQLQWALDAARRDFPGVDLRRAGIRYDIVELIVLISHLQEMRHSAATTVTLHATNESYFDILRAFGMQIDIPVSVSSRPEPGLGQENMDWVYSTRATLNLERANYWDALKAIRQSLDLVSTFSGDAVTFNRRSGGRYPDFPLDAASAVVAGPLLIAPTSAERQNSEITLTLHAVAEPKTRSGRYGEYATVRLDEVLDDRGRSLLNPSSRSSFTSVSTDIRLRTAEDTYWNFKVPVQLPVPSSGRRIGKVRGRFGVAVGPPGLDLVIADLTRGDIPSFEWDGVVVTVTSVHPAGSQFVVTGEFSSPAESPLSKAMIEKDTSGWAMENARGRLAEHLALLDAAGKFIRREITLGAVRHETDRDVMDWTLTTMGPTRFRGGADICDTMCVPVTLTWSADFETRWLMTPFELSSIPTPIEVGK